jgi:hypothetical protein
LGQRFLHAASLLGAARRAGLGIEVDQQVLMELDCLIIIFGIENEDPLLFFDVLKEKETFI